MKHRKQHYIPVSYLSPWCDPSCPPKYTPYIWVFEKDSKVGKKKAPQNVFYESDMYTISDEKRKRNLRIEKGFGCLEQDFVSVRDMKLHCNRILNENDITTICLYIAAMNSRTRSWLDHISNEFNCILNKMNELNEFMKTKTKNQRKSLAEGLRIGGDTDNRSSLSYDQVKRIVENPVDTVMLARIQAEAELFRKLDLAIFTTNSESGFITSDNPCVWFDPEAHKRPFLLNQPSLAFKTIKITMPVSPTHCILLNRMSLNGYIQLDNLAVRELNRRHRSYCIDCFVVNQNYVDEFWFNETGNPRLAVGNYSLPKWIWRSRNPEIQVLSRSNIVFETRSFNLLQGRNW